MDAPQEVTPASMWISLRRYWPYALVIGVVAGLFAWWVLGSYAGGVLVGALLFGGAILAGWELDPFLPQERRARSHLKRRSG